MGATRISVIAKDKWQLPVNGQRGEIFNAYDAVANAFDDGGSLLIWLTL